MEAASNHLPAPHAWCTDCDWKNGTPQCEAVGRSHSDSFQHIVHIFEPEPINGEPNCG